MPSQTPDTDPGSPPLHAGALSAGSLLATLPSALRDVLAARRARHAERLDGLFRRLYGGHPDADLWLARLHTVVAERVRMRPAHLHALDHAREATPGWYLEADAVGYCAYVDRLGGTLAGVCPRIPHLRRLGVRYLHLLPFLKARAGDNDGGFAIADFDTVEPRLGTMAELETLTGELRANGIGLCADFVLNHVADDHEWARRALAGDPHFRAFFHLFPDRTEPDRYEQTVRQIFPVAAPGNFTWRPELAAWVWTTFYPYQWDLNYANPAVFVAIADALMGLANRGIEIFRLDSVGFLWKRPGTDCMNQAETHWIVQALRAVLDLAAPSVVLKAEAIVPTRDLPPYFGMPDQPGRECQLAYHSSLMAAAWSALALGDARILHAVLAETPALPAGCAWLTYVRCHDDIGWPVLAPTLASAGLPAQDLLRRVSRFYAGDDGSFADGMAFQAADPDAVHGTNGMTASLLGLAQAASPEEEEAALRRLVLMYGLACAVGGLPVIYMGDELGQGNDRSAASLAMQSLDGRWLQRPVLDQQALDSLDGSGRPARAFAALRSLIGARAAMPALAADRGIQVLDCGPAALLAFLRGSSTLVLSNWSGQSIDWEPAWRMLQPTLTAAGLPTDPERWREHLAGGQGDTRQPLPAWGMLWLSAVE